MTGHQSATDDEKTTGEEKKTAEGVANDDKSRSNPGNEGLRSDRTENDDRSLEELAEGD
jgi:hypothetical protein